MDLLERHLASDAVVMMDDIDDNTFFRDWVTQHGRPCTVVERGRKYVGIVGLATDS
jgi:hypothetical protein